MSFIVRNEDEASDDIADLYQNAPNPSAVGRAIIEARQRLVANPL